MVVNAALYPPACPTRIRKSRLVIPIEKHLALEGFCIQPLLSSEKVERILTGKERMPRLEMASWPIAKDYKDSGICNFNVP
jgi:hypothetical protein